MFTIGVVEQKRHQVWNHFVARWAMDKRCASPYLTGPRLRKIHARLWKDNGFWDDIVLRHNMTYSSPEYLEKNEPDVYQHALGNFWGQVTDTGLRLGLPL